MKVNVWLVFLFSGILWACGTKEEEELALQIIPQPENIIFKEGRFQLDRGVGIIVPENVTMGKYVEILQDMISGIAGYSLKTDKRNKNNIQLSVDTTLVDSSEEGYQLKITSEFVHIIARNEVGVFYGLQTFRQLLTDPQFYNEQKKQWSLPALTIKDHPAFPYRGLHLDVSRHFFPKEFVMKCLDLMAEYKLNRFHWHLTDAAGWRIEIKKYPELTERGAWRTQENYMDWWNGDRHYVTRNSAGAYGGFYTQQNIREVVVYAEKKHITIIPEFEMPGHSEEVVSIYPELGCYGKPYRNGELCIGNEKTFNFVEDVLSEMIELFPSEYIHIGGDEASTVAWKHCPKCQKRMKDFHLKNEKELQSYMIHRIGDFLKSKGRKLIGWDEILEGGLAPDATVMSWRGEAGGIKAARMGHDVIMTPGAYCYFDNYQADPRTQPAAIGGFLPYLKVYSYSPVPKELTPEEARHILGAQANVWAEYISTTAHVEYMIYPRLLALAEVVWTPQCLRKPEDFKRRITHHIDLLKEKGVNVFTLSNHIDIQTEVDTVEHRIKVGFDAEKYQPEIHYVVNGGEEKVYQEPFYVTDSARIIAFIVVNGQQSDEVLETRLDYHRAIGKRVNYNTRYSSSYPAAKEVTLTDGLRGGLTYGDGRWQGFLTHIDLVIDLDSISDLSYVSARFMQLIGPGVYMPDFIVVSVSEDGQTFEEIARIMNDVPVEKKELVIKDFATSFKARGRYVKFYAHKHAGFQFIDEIVVY